jgi:hypothetical protein
MLDRPITERLNRRTIRMDPFVIGTLIAGFLVVLLLVFGNDGFPRDTNWLTP